MNAGREMVIFIASMLEIFLFAIGIVYGIFYSVQESREGEKEEVIAKNKELERENKELREELKKHEIALEKENDYGAQDCRDLVYGKRD